MVLLSLGILLVGLLESIFVFNNETNTVSVFHKGNQVTDTGTEFTKNFFRIRTAPNSLTSAVSVSEGWIIVN